MGLASQIAEPLPGFLPGSGAGLLARGLWPNTRSPRVMVLAALSLTLLWFCPQWSATDVSTIPLRAPAPPVPQPEPVATQSPSRGAPPMPLPTNTPSPTTRLAPAGEPSGSAGGNMPSGRGSGPGLHHSPGPAMEAPPTLEAYASSRNAQAPGPWGPGEFHGSAALALPTYKGWATQHGYFKEGGTNPFPPSVGGPTDGGMGAAEEGTHDRVPTRAVSHKSVPYTPMDSLSATRPRDGRRYGISANTFGPAAADHSRDPTEFQGGGLCCKTPRAFLKAGTTGQESEDAFGDVFAPGSTNLLGMTRTRSPSQPVPRTLPGSVSPADPQPLQETLAIFLPASFRISFWSQNSKRPRKGIANRNGSSQMQK